MVKIQKNFCRGDFPPPTPLLPSYTFLQIIQQDPLWQTNKINPHKGGGGGEKKKGYLLYIPLNVRPYSVHCETSQEEDLLSHGNQNLTLNK